MLIVILLDDLRDFYHNEVRYLDPNLKPNRFQMGLIKSIGIDKFLAERENNLTLSVDMKDGPDAYFLALERKM